MDLRAQMDANTVIVGDLNNPLSPPTDMSSRQNINKETSEQLHILDQMDILDIYRVFHPTIRKYKSFSADHRTFSKIDHFYDTKQVSTNSLN
jgi:hypothetical protein